jgi:hypothetical protein
LWRAHREPPGATTPCFAACSIASMMWL